MLRLLIYQQPMDFISLNVINETFFHLQIQNKKILWLNTRKFARKKKDSNRSYLDHLL